MERTLTVDALEIPFDVDTLEGFRAWVRTLDEDAPRVHYYRGRVHLEMAPQSWRRHLPVASDINTALGGLARELDLGRYFEQGGWITNEEAELSTEPDGALVLWETFRSGEAEIAGGETELELRGRVDVALEVVSKTSRRKDTQELVEGYAAAGVPEYWIVELTGETLSFRLLVLEGGVYRERRPDAQGWRESPVWGGRFRLSLSTDPAGLPRVDVEFQSPA